MIGILSATISMHFCLADIACLISAIVILDFWIINSLHIKRPVHLSSSPSITLNHGESYTSNHCISSNTRDSFSIQLLSSCWCERYPVHPKLTMVAWCLSIQINLILVWVTVLYMVLHWPCSYPHLNFTRFRLLNHSEICATVLLQQSGIHLLTELCCIWHCSMRRPMFCYSNDSTVILLHLLLFYEETYFCDPDS